MAESVNNNDWRRRGQERYLLNKAFVLQKYRVYSEKWDHDHCCFCTKKISLNAEDISFGYATDDGYYWVCSDCFNDFKDEFDWSVISDERSVEEKKRNNES